MKLSLPQAGARLIALGLLAAGLVGLWQVLPLRIWTFTGPGPGLFPQILAAICIFFALLELVAPRAGALPGQGLDEPIEQGPPTAAERRTFAFYAVGLIAMSIGAGLVGFGLTAIMLMVLILRFGERRSWAAALGYGIAWSVVGWLLFGWLLGINIPEGPLDRAVLGLVR